MKKYAVIVAGGSGSRMKTSIPKQFLLLGDKPVLMHTITRFYEADQSTILRVVLPQQEIEEWNQLCKQYQFDIQHEIIPGGPTRFDSVKNGLQGVDKNSLVAIHDGVRPLVTHAIIQKSFDVAGEKGSAITAVGLKDSIREQVDDSTVTRDRENYFLVQTPQTFHSALISSAYGNASDGALFTDDASVFEANGGSAVLIEGDYRNLKITTPEDLLIAQALLGNGVNPS